MATGPNWVFWINLGPWAVDHIVIESGASHERCNSLAKRPALGIAFLFTRGHRNAHADITTLWHLGKGVDSALRSVAVDLVNFGDRVQNGQSGIRRGGAIGLIGPTEGRGSMSDAPF